MSLSSNVFRSVALATVMAGGASAALTQFAQFQTAGAASFSYCGTTGGACTNSPTDTGALFTSSQVVDFAFLGVGGFSNTPLAGNLNYNTNYKGTLTWSFNTANKVVGGTSEGGFVGSFAITFSDPVDPAGGSDQGKVLLSGVVTTFGPTPVGATLSTSPTFKFPQFTADSTDIGTHLTYSSFFLPNVMNDSINTLTINNSNLTLAVGSSGYYQQFSGPFNGNFSADPPPQLPEPASVLLFASGLGALGIASRYRKKSRG